MQAYFLVFNLAVLLGIALPLVVWIAFRMSKSRPGLRRIVIWGRNASIAVFLGVTCSLTLFAVILGQATISDLPMALVAYGVIGFVAAALIFCMVLASGVVVSVIKGSRSKSDVG